MTKKNLRFVVALEPEASMLIVHYHLELEILYKNLFKLYANLEHNIWLVISGIGNINSAAAAAYLYGVSPFKEKNIWINIGMGGSATYKVGSIFNIKKINYKRNNTLKTYYTSALINDYISAGEVENVDEQEKKFLKKKSIYEMEAYGFIRVVEKFCKREQICIIKIISDNKKNPPNNFSKEVKGHMRYNLIKITKVIDAYLKISLNILEVNISIIDKIIKKFHLTFSHRVIIIDLVYKIEKIFSKEELIKLIDDSENIKSLIKKLQHKINSHNLKV